MVFLDHVTGFPGIPGLLKPETIKIMTTPSPAYPAGSAGKYARGWMVRNDGEGNWWHTGSFAGDDDDHGEDVDGDVLGGVDEYEDGAVR